MNPSNDSRARSQSHDWVKHDPDAEFCHACGARLIIGPIVHKPNITGLDPYCNDVIADCSCRWRRDFVWTQANYDQGETTSRSLERAKAAVAAHVAEALPELRCPNEPTPA